MRIHSNGPSDKQTGLQRKKSPYDSTNVSLTPSHLLRLQQALGNHLTVQMLSGSRSQIDRPKAEVIQRYVAAQIVPDDTDDTLIGEINIQGRSPSPVGFTGMGDHLTMWAVLTDSVENRLRGKTYVEAYQELLNMEQEVRDLPGYGNYVNMTTEQQVQQNIARFELGAAFDQVAAASPVAIALRLQQCIEKFLDWRNLIPFTTFQFGVATSKKGQQTSLTMLRQHESGDVVYSEAELRVAVMGTLDYEAISQAANASTKAEVRPDMPGINPGESNESRMAEMIENHLRNIESAYPTALEDASIDSYLRTWLNKKGLMLANEIADILFERYGRD